MTIKQRQCLLAYLGYYNGQMDGIWGQQSQKATEAFQRDYSLNPDGVFGPETEKRILEVVASGEQPVGDKMSATANWWDRYPNFIRTEFRCRCGGKYCGGFPAEPKEKLVALLQKIRNHYGKPVKPVSGLRCEKWNAIQGGVKTSRHRLGQAMDFYISGVSPEEIVSWVKKTCPECAYVYAIKKKDGNLAGTVHVDVLI